MESDQQGFSDIIVMHIGQHTTTDFPEKMRFALPLPRSRRCQDNHGTPSLKRPSARLVWPSTRRHKTIPSAAKVTSIGLYLGVSIE
jgi:hypothetical protein